jgi:hypothetical protein
MRTTITLSDSLGSKAKARALAEGRTFTSLVEEGLRMVLAEERAESGAESVQPLPTFGDPDDDFLVDLSDREALWYALDADGPR